MKFLDSISRVYLIASSILRSKRFTYAVIAIFVVQAVWVALTFSWVIFDEMFHFGIINVYTNHMWPTIYNQPLAYDVYRDFAGEGSKLYHFLMSFPLRFIEMFVQDSINQLRILRLLNVGFVAVGLVYIYKLFSVVGLSRSLSNIIMLAFVTLPITPWIGGTVNYDNFIFMLTPIFIILSISQYRNPNSVRGWLGLLVIGMLASLAKFTFLPIFLIGALVPMYALWRSDTRRLTGWSELRRPIALASTAVLVVLTFLFVQTYGLNTIRYGTPRPSCEASLGLERCRVNSVIKRNEELRVAKQNTQRKSAPLYSYDWLHEMHRKFFYSYGSKEQPPVPGVLWSYSALGMLGLLSVVAVATYRTRILGQIGVLLAFVLVYIAIVFVEHYKIYEEYAIPLAVQSRYLLPVLPIIMAGMIVSLQTVLRDKLPDARYRLTVIAMLGLLGIGILQGGGILTHLVRMDSSRYWPGISQRINGTLNTVLERITY